MKTHLKVALFSLALLITPSLSAAPITIDDLTRGGSASDDGAAAPGTPNAQGVGAGHVGARTLFAQHTTGLAGTTSISILGGALSSGNTTNGGNSFVDYSAIGGASFTGGILTFNVTTANITAGGEIDMDITIDGVTIDSGITGTGLFSLDLLAAGFTAANLASVDQFRLSFTFDSAEDLEFQGDGGIRIREIPEPTSLAICGLFAIGGAYYVRRRRSA